MGDTLTHLGNKADVSRLFDDAFSLTRCEGILVLSFRDLSGELHGLERFIPVRADADKVMTCFVEYEADQVIVHDLLYVRHCEQWELHKSSYPKLRLSEDWVAHELEGSGFQLIHRECNTGMWTIAAQRPNSTG